MSSSATPVIDQPAVTPLDPPPRPPVLAIIVPCYNEQEVLPETTGRLCHLLRDLVQGGQIDASSRIWFIDDGSRDRTWPLISHAAGQPDSRVSGIKLSRNRGHQIALLAGLLTAGAMS